MFNVGRGTSTVKKRCVVCNRPVRGVRKAKKYVCANKSSCKGKRTCRQPHEVRVSGGRMSNSMRKMLGV